MVGISNVSRLFLQTYGTNKIVKMSHVLDMWDDLTNRIVIEIWTDFLRAFYVYRVTELLLNQEELPTLTTEKTMERL